MAKVYDRTRWKNYPKREIQIFRQLEDGSKTFSELFNELGWGSLTLTNYLKNLVEKGYIGREERGRNVFYTLIQSNTYVRQMLNLDRWPSNAADVRIQKRIVLNELDEKKFIADWINSIKFCFLNVIQDYMLLGKRMRESEKETNSVNTLRRFLEGHIQDMVDTINYQGAVMAKRVRLGTLNPDRIWEVRNKLLKQIKNEIMNIT